MGRITSNSSVALMLAIGMCVGAASAGRPVPNRYSGYHCYGTDSKAKGSPETRTCKFTNICLGDDGKWVYHVKGGAAGLTANELAFLSSKNVVSYGPLARHAMEFRIADGPASAPNQTGRATVLNCAQSSSYSRWLLDDLFGLHWMIKFHDAKSPDDELIKQDTMLPNAEKIDLVNMCRVTRYSEIFNIMFTNRGQFSLEWKHRLLRNQASGSGSTTPADAADFRRFLYRVSTSGKSSTFPAPSKVLAMHAVKARHVANIFDLVEAVTARGAPAELAFLDNLEFGAKVDMTAHAAVAVAIHGEDSANLAFLQENATFVEIFPFGAERDGRFEKVAALFGVKYAAWQAKGRESAEFRTEALDKNGVVGATRERVRMAADFAEAVEAVGGRKELVREFWMDQNVMIDVEEVEKIVVEEYQSKNIPKDENEGEEGKKL